MITKTWKRIVERTPKVSAALARIRYVLLTLASLGTGVAACWTAWGVPAGLGSLAVAFLLLEWATRDDDAGSGTKGAA